MIGFGESSPWGRPYFRLAKYDNWFRNIMKHLLEDIWCTQQTMCKSKDFGFPVADFVWKKTAFVAGTPRRASWREIFKTPGLATWVLHMAIGTSWEINGNYMCGTFNLSSAWSQILLRMGCALKKTMQWVWVFVLCEFWDAQIRFQIGEHLLWPF